MIGNIDLVEDEEFGFGTGFEALQNTFHLRAEAALGIDQQHDHVGILRPAPRRLHHRAVEAALPLKNAGRVDEEDLGVVLNGNAHQADARCLCLRADNRHFLSDQRVDERRFARVGRAEDGNEAAFHLSCSSKTEAAAVSASCFDVPEADASPALPMLTVTVKVGL